jgi:ribosomal protein S18 acetylase RimI-like enzyme
MISLLDPTVTVASPADRRQLVDVITRAFASDPPSRWLYPEHDQYWRFFPRFVEVFGGKAVESGSAQVIGDGAAALWLPPGVHVDDAPLVALIEESVDERDRPTAFSLFEQMASYHPAEPHWYLPLIGVAPDQQGRGYGSILLEHAVARCDREGLPAYLESTTPRSVPLYRRHGFEVVAELRIGSAPPIFPMVRKPR